MRARNHPREVVLPRVKLFTEPDGYVIALECFCGGAVQYPGHPETLELSRCERCGQPWRCLEPADLLRLLGG